MDGRALMSAFANAAPPQKIVLVALAAAVLAIPVAAALEPRRPNTGPWRGLIGSVRLAGPMLGLLVGAMNSFHMGRTIQRAPFEITDKQIAPGVLEVSTLIGLGALVGVVAAAAHQALSLGGRRLR